MGRKSYLGIKQKMAPARGSSMPYTAFSKEERSAIAKASLKTEPVYVSEKPVSTTATLGTTLDALIKQSKDMGLKIKISFSSEDQD